MYLCRRVKSVLLWHIYYLHQQKSIHTTKSILGVWRMFALIFPPLTPTEDPSDAVPTISANQNSCGVHTLGQPFQGHSMGWGSLEGVKLLCSGTAISRDGRVSGASKAWRFGHYLWYATELVQQGRYLWSRSAKTPMIRRGAREVTVLLTAILLSGGVSNITNGDSFSNFRLFASRDVTFRERSSFTSLRLF